MGEIRVLPPLLVDQIAAGEVIERPAAVVKELVENALDAGATAVRVDLGDGGRDLIRVTDDGKGILPEDLPLAFESHATSKLSEAADLFRVKTLGFRGEALASVGAVAQVHVATRVRGAVEGAEIRVDGGARGEVRAAGTPEGTRVEVRNLFFNVPARKKFLRSPQVEYAHAHDVLTRFALSHSGVRLEFHHNGQGIFTLTPADGPVPRIAQFFGQDLADALVSATVEAHGLKARAWLAPPRFSKVSARSQFFFLNGRFIRDRVIGKAIHEAYRELIPHGRYAAAFLFLDVPPADVDVNVHPTKIEVRFRQIWRVHDVLADRFREALRASDLVPPVPLDRESAYASPGAGAMDPRRVDAERAIADFFSQPLPATAGAGTGTEIGSTSLTASRGDGDPGIPDSPYPRVSDSPSHIPSSATLAPAARPAAAGAAVFPEQLRVFQIHDRYLVEEVPGGIVLIDQHALHERYLYETIRGRWQSRQALKQNLLVPMVADLSPADRARLEDVRPHLEALGFEIEDFGGTSAVIRAVPDFLKDEDPVQLLRDLLDAEDEDVPSSKFQVPSFKSDSGVPISNPPAPPLEALLHRMACHGAVKAGDRLGPEEIRRLLAGRGEIDHHATCVHGRPTHVKISLEDLERYFKRRL